jgi:predicted secreted Zn-dependent protease
MAVKANTVEATQEAINSSIMDSVREMLEEHGEEIQSVLNECAEKCVTVTFKNDIDCSESKATVKTAMRFSQTYCDERTKEIDVTQGTFKTLEDAGRGGRKKDKKPKEGEPAKDPEPEAA